MKKDDKIKAIKTQDILYWILLNSGDTQAMDAINFSSYPHTSKYKRYRTDIPREDNNY